MYKFLKELEGSLDGWLGPSLTVLGELCLEGTLQERNHKSRQVFLFEKMLLITKRKEDGRLAYKSHIMVSPSEKSYNKEKYSTIG